ncbi:MAG: D-alanyl-D-alanine carboxypeptidase/D-alanyl-D-alanine-endopeptidase [Actinomycetota bacterium]|nr:D-alanyl-D-alanine carboxypeptidase/D-alanyl-D-alanine-endopeptidase [Actinomycetota bacterium]
MLPATLMLLALAAGAVGGCGAAGTGTKRATHSRAAGTTVPAPSTQTKTTAAATAPGVAGAAPLGGVRQLGVELAHQLGIAGRNSGAYVYDLTTGTPVFSLRATTKRPPASVEKLFTSMAALYQMGPRARFRTTVLGHGRLGPGGVWHGSLYLRGGGDPTFGSSGFNHLYEKGYGPTVAQLVAQLTGDGIRRVSGRVIGDASLFDSKPGVPSSGFAPDLGDIGGELSALTYDHGLSGKLTPGAFAAHALALALRADHVWALAATHTGTTPADAGTLARVSSPPLWTLLRLMNVPSDDLFAETLTKQMGARFAGAGTTAAGAKAISSTIETSYGLHPKIVDGSGLSRHDRASPLEVVDLLRAVWRTPLGSLLWDSLPTVGVEGTVTTIATGTPAQGHCVAKTGTLNDVTNLAGYCHSAGHQVVAFALFVDGPANWQAIPIMGKMVAAIARRDPASP